MVATYNILGRQVQSHWLAIGTLATTFAGGFYAMSGKKKDELAKGPAINAGSKAEEDFIQEFLKQHQHGDGAKH